MGFYIISGLASMPGFYWREIEGFSAKDWDARIAPDRFNNREVMAHLADWEPIFRSRFQAALREDPEPVFAADEGQRALDLNYASTDPMEQFELWKREREATVALLEAAEQSELYRLYQHPVSGAMSALDLAGRMLGHDIYHLEQLIWALKA